MGAGWRFCGTMKFAFRVDAQGQVIEFATTNKSHPHGAMVDERPILMVSKKPASAR